MCGIVSYIGNKNAKDILLEGLKSLEYRGYDSSGIALVNEGIGLDFVKSVGKISDLEQSVNSDTNANLSSTCGIGHTRWATHGEANQTNAHPHKAQFNDQGNIALVHNGIIKNYLELKRRLQGEGVKFETETDTEVVVKLFAANKQKASNKTDLDALRDTVKELDGSYAFAILCYDKDSSKKILVARNESPLVIGVGENENFVASDSTTVLQFTDKVIRLQDLELAEITEDKITVENIKGETITPTVHQLVKTASILEKGDYKHFLLKEIYEQPSVIRKILSEKNFDHIQLDYQNLNRIVIVACGTAYHAALIAKTLIELWAKVPVETAVASEYLTAEALAGKNDLVIGISQSGETADTLGAIRNAQSNGANVLCITNKDDSAIVDLCKPNSFVTPAGPEVSVAATKTFTAQVLSLYLFALKLATERGTLTQAELDKIHQDLHCLPQLMDQAIERSAKYHDEFVKYSEFRDFLFLSRGINYPIALEGALKLKELSYIHATGYASGEMKHGPIAILDHSVPVLSVAISGETEYEESIYFKTLHNAEEARARKSPSLVVACDDNPDVDGLFDTVIRIPNIGQLLSPIIAVIPLQFLAYYIAEDLGKDVDQPRNLAKSVTVE